MVDQSLMRYLWHGLKKPTYNKPKNRKLVYCRFITVEDISDRMRHFSDIRFSGLVGRFLQTTSHLEKWHVCILNWKVI